MPTTEEKLDTLIAKLRTLPAERKELAVDVLIEITEDRYVLSDDELTILKPALVRAQRGEHVPDEEMSALLDKPWR